MTVPPSPKNDTAQSSDQTPLPSSDAMSGTPALTEKEGEAGTPKLDFMGDTSLNHIVVDALRREVENLTQALSSSKSYIASLEASIRGSDSGFGNANTSVELERKKGGMLGIGLGMPSVPDPQTSGEGGLQPPISGISANVPLPHSLPMFDLRRKASGQLGSQASDARAALALKLEGQTRGDNGNGGLQRKGVNRIPSSVVQSHISLADSTSPAKNRQYRSNSINGNAPSSPTTSDNALSFPILTRDDVEESDDGGGAEEILQDETADRDNDNAQEMGLSRSVTPTGRGGLTSRIPRPSDAPATSPVTGVVAISPPRPRLRANPSTQMISTLQQQVETHRQHLDRVKAELRASQRLVAQLTRQNEDLKETKERMRAENDSLGVMISRKERLLTEVLERARSAEATAATSVKERKQLEGSTKKSLAEMKDKMEAATLTATRSEREAVILREAVTSLKDSWKKEVRTLRAEIKEAYDAVQLQRQEADDKHSKILAMIDTQSTDKRKLASLQIDLDQNDDKLLGILQPDLQEIRRSLSSTEAHEQQNHKIAAYVRFLLHKET
ncbi:hypothetical protein QFC20_002246 [Naganishia adeliensis]|uniref:Uncharacterized protein n=1 Tax=Naganishia adeliensis TaxID=92952 RepID=A0ACC2WM10_9TREE|nr:hypothetical protein QFC20_002246 [Naganishia adeliensis]